MDLRKLFSYLLIISLLLGAYPPVGLAQETEQAGIIIQTELTSVKELDNITKAVVENKNNMITDKIQLSKNKPEIPIINQKPKEVVIADNPQYYPQEPIRVTVNQEVSMDNVLYGNSVYYKALKQAGKTDILNKIDVKNIDRVSEMVYQNVTSILNLQPNSVSEKVYQDVTSAIQPDNKPGYGIGTNKDSNTDKKSINEANNDNNEKKKKTDEEELNQAKLDAGLMQTMSTTGSQKAFYNTIVGPSTMNNVNNEKYSSWADMSETISPETGELTYKVTDIKLPGRNGLDLDISRIYQSNQALWGDRKCTADLNIGTSDYSTYYLNRYALGLGWSLGFPSVQVETDEGQTELYYHTGKGPIYHVVFTADTTDSNLEDYYKKDAIFNTDTSFSNGQVNSSYVFIASDQTKQYFAADGRLLAIVDRFGNRNLFQHIERPVTNFAPNYSFQYPESQAIWTTNSYYSYDQTVGMETNQGKSLKYYSASPVTASSMSKNLEVLPSTKYYLSAYINDQLTQGNCGLSYYEYDAYYNYINQGTLNGPAIKSSWQQSERYFNTSSNTKYIRIEFRNVSAAGSSWMDTVRFDRAWPLISNITDSIGRNITFTYTDNLYNANPTIGQIHVAITDPTNSSSLGFDFNTMPFTETMNFTQNGQTLWQEERKFPSLCGFYDGNKNYWYNYFIDTNPMERFTFVSKDLNNNPAWGPRSLLSDAGLNRSKIHYDWEKITKHMGANGAYETYRVNNRYEQNYTASGYQGSNYHQQYSYAGNYNGTVYNNETGYPGAYGLDKDASFLFTSTLQQDNGLATSQTFKGGKQYKIEKTIPGGEKDITYNEEYDTRFPKQPTKVRNEKTSNSGTATYYIGNIYNDWGGLSSMSRPLTQGQWNDTTIKNQNTTTFTYDPTYKFLATKRYYQKPGQQLVEATNYDSLGRIQYFVDAKGQKTNYSYQDSQRPGNLTRESIAMDANRTRITEYNYTNNNSIGSWPTMITQYYTENGVAKSSSTTNTYDYLRGNVISSTNALNNTTNCQYDQFGRIIQIMHPSSTGKDGAYVLKENYQYDYYFAPELNQQYVLRVLNYFTKNDSIVSESYNYYDEHGILLMNLKLDLEKNTWLTTSYGINQYGQLASIIDPKGNTTNYTADPWNRIKTITDAQSNIQQYEYDILSNTKTTYFVPNGGTRENDYVEQYDQWGNCTSRKGYPNGWGTAEVVEEKYEYDLVNNCVKKTDPKNNITLYQYDQLNRLNKVTDALGQVVDYTYDRLGALQTQQQYAGTQAFTTTRNNNERGLRTSTQEPGGQLTSYIYNNLGLPSQITDPNGKVSTIQYYSDGTVSQVTSNNETITNYYSPFGVERYTNTLTQEPLDYEYYSTGLTKKRMTAGNYHLNFQYDNNGNLTQQTDPFSMVQSYAYDSLNRNTSITSGNKVFGYEYYNDGMIKAVNYPNGLRTEYTYDNINRLKILINKKGTTTVSSYSYTYDNNGNIIQANENGQVSNYEYDALNRLTKTVRPNGDQVTYTYDSRGNRIQSTGDANITTFIQGSFTYNNWDQMKSFNSGNNIYNYEYDPEGLRTKKTSSGGTTRYHYNNDGQVIAETDAGNVVEAQTIWGDKALARIIGGQYYYYVYNGHGDVVLIIDENGNVKNAYTYDEWGNITNQQEQVSNPLKYAGEYYDNESGLYYLRARYYDPTIGRFISKDSVEGNITNPLSLNLYTYVENNPLAYIDPSGHWSVSFNVSADTGAVISVSWGTVSSGSSGSSGGSDSVEYVVASMSVPTDNKSDTNSNSITSNSSKIYREILLASAGSYDFEQTWRTNNNSWKQRYTDKPGGTVDINIRGAALLGITGGVQIDSEGNTHPYIGPSLGFGGGASISYSNSSVSHGLNTNAQATVLFLNGGVNYSAGNRDPHKFHYDSSGYSTSIGAGFGLGLTVSEIIVY